MDVATLGLEISNSAANAAITDTGAKLDALATSGESAQQRVLSASERATQSQIRQAQQVQRLGREYDLLGSSDIAKASQWYDQMFGATTKVTAATENSISGLGRLRYSMGSLAARATDTSPIVGRFAGVLGGFAVGNPWTLAILAGIAAVGYAWKTLGAQADDLATKVSDAMKKVHAETVSAQLAMGDLQLARAKADVQAAQSRLSAATPTYDAKTGLDVNAANRTGAAEALVAANAELFAAQQTKNQIDYQMSGDAYKNAADNLALLVHTNHATHEERQRAIATYRSDLTEIAALGKSQTDNVRRAQLIEQSETLKSALYPKSADADARKEAAAQRKAWTEMMRPLGKTVPDLAAIGAGSGGGSGFARAGHNAAQEYVDAFWKGVDQSMSAKSVSKGALAEIKAAPDNFQNLIDRAQVMQVIADTTNAQRAAHHQKALPQGTELTEVKRQALDMGQAMERAVTASNLPLKQQLELLKQIEAQLKQIGDSAPNAKPGNSWDTMSMQDKITSGLRSAGDAASLFGGARGAQLGNLLNTGANAVTNVGAAAKDSFANPIADAQAVLSVASFGKQLLGLGGISHDAARQISEAKEALTMNLDITADKLTHNTLQGLLDQDKIQYDQLYKSINDTLPGLKNQAQRNIDLTTATADYNAMLVQTRQNYALQQKDFNMSLTARMDAAHGLTYSAALINLQIKQQDEMNAAIQGGADAAQQATLAQVQLAEKTMLANQQITQLANSPTGFFAERYFGQYALPTGSSNPTMPTSPPAPTTPQTFNGPINFTIHGSGNPQTMAQAVFDRLRAIKGQTVGYGGSMADALEYT